MATPSVNPVWLVPGEEALSQLDSDPHGLSDAEVQNRLDCFGHNRLREKPPRSPWLKFLDQFNNFLVMALLGAAVLAGAIGDLKDTLVILAVILFNAGLGFYQEYRAESTLSALKKMLPQHARVRRGGEVLQIAAEHLVPGDILLIEAGDRVPADGRVLAAHNAEVAEAALTGESNAVGKFSDPLAPGVYALAERGNMVFMNTVVTRGRLEVLVSATGMDSEMGRITGLLESAQEHATPLQIQIDSLGKRLALVAGVTVSLIFVLGLLHGDPLVQTILTSIALAVAAIPEGLPAVVTVTLAIGMHRMAKNRAIVKKLSAVETLGSTSVICSDKTGTLTLNQMTARQLYFYGRRFSVSGEGYSGKGSFTAEDGQVMPDMSPLLTAVVLCNESRIRDGQLIGDPTEGALLVLAIKGGVEPDALAEQRPRIAEVPFDSAHKFMATFHYGGEWVRMMIKGAPDVLLARASRSWAASGEAPLSDEARSEFDFENEYLANQAMRVLAVACRDIPASDFDPTGDLMSWAQELTLIGLIGIIDPPRPEARDAIRLCKLAGIQVKMITGDHAVTAAAIAHELGLEGKVMTGAELDRLGVNELAACIESTAVFARVAPEHKVKIIQALKALGHVVAMTGDGVNDAPALKNADIGVAMGITGTEVTKEAAVMVLTDDNFATLVSAVKEGRTLYDNIIKFVRFQLSTNIGAILSVLGAQLLGLATPFTAIQILWINIIMDGPPAMTLGLEPARPGIMCDKPRSQSVHILTTSRLWHVFSFGLVMAIGTIGVFTYGLRTGGEAYAMTMAFTTFVLFQFFNVFNARTEHGTAFNSQLFTNGKLWLTLLSVVSLQAVVVHWDVAQAIFHTTDLTASDWGLSFAVAGSVLLLEELRKFLKSF